MTLRCKCNNEFSVKFRYFKYQNRRTCKECNNLKNRVINNLELAIDFVKSKSNNTCEIVSTEYVDNKTPLKIKCNCGDVFECSIKNIRQRKVLQCAECSFDKFRMSNDELVSLAKSAGCNIVNISDYRNEDSVLKFTCACGDEFSTTLASFKGSKKRCNECYKDEASYTQRRSFYDIKSEVSKTDCELISKSGDYINQYSNLRFKCSCGRVFKRSYANFMARDKMCLTCTATKGEKEVAKFLELKGISYEREKIFEGLVSEKGYPLRFDFSIPDIAGNTKFLIEYDGEFHYSAIISEDDFERQKHNDNLKDEYCLHNNIPLLRIPYFHFDKINIIIEDFLSKVNTEVKHSVTAVAHRRA